MKVQANSYDGVAIAAGGDVSVNGVKARHSSASVEHYTPPAIVEAARATMGGIDLDPFSCAKANETVKATNFHRLGGPIDGWIGPWWGRVFINPPGGRIAGNKSSQKAAWFKLMQEYGGGRVTRAIFVAFSVEILQTTQIKPLGFGNVKIPLQFPICYPRNRVAYLREDGTIGASPPHSSCIIYLPPARTDGIVCEREAGIDLFRERFGSIGHVVVPQ